MALEWVRRGFEPQPTALQSLHPVELRRERSIKALVRFQTCWDFWPCLSSARLPPKRGKLLFFLLPILAEICAALVGLDACGLNAEIKVSTGSHEVIGLTLVDAACLCCCCAVSAMKGLGFEERNGHAATSSIFSTAITWLILKPEKLENKSPTGARFRRPLVDHQRFQ